MVPVSVPGGAQEWRPWVVDVDGGCGWWPWVAAVAVTVGGGRG
jgi:hypothetical protein